MKKIAICVGHSRGDKGAVSTGGVTEWDYNIKVTDRLQDILERAGVSVTLFDHYPASTYKGAMGWLAESLNNLGPDCAIELHFNSASPEAEGYEYLYWQGSLRGKRLAECLLNAHEDLLMPQEKRGAKAITAGSRGAAFLRGPKTVCCLCEPFFGSSAKEWSLFEDDAGMDNLARTYANGLADFLDIKLTIPFRRAPEASPVDPGCKARLNEIRDRVERIKSHLIEIEKLLPHDP